MWVLLHGTHFYSVFMKDTVKGMRIDTGSPCEGGCEARDTGEMFVILPGGILHGLECIELIEMICVTWDYRDVVY